MRNVAVLVDGAFYLKIGHRALLHRGVISDKTDIKEQASIIAENLVSRCLRHIYAGEAYGEGTDTKAYKKARELERLYRIFFYDCPPLLKKVHHPLTGRAIDHSKTETALLRIELHQQLIEKRNLALRLGVLDEDNARWKIQNPEVERDFISGKLLREGKQLSESDIVYYAQQKSVDMKIGLDIASLAYKGIVSKIVLISGDSDFVPVAKLARREGIEFILDAMGHNIKKNLREHIDGLGLPTSNFRRKRSRGA